MTGGSFKAPTGTGRARGAILEQSYVKRTVFVYPLYESEVRHLKSDTDRAATYFSAGGALIAFGVGIATNAMFADWAKLAPEARVAIRLLLPLLVVAGVYLLYLGRRARREANETLDALKTPAGNAPP